MRWVRLEGGEHVLVVAPLHGRGNRDGEGQGVRLLAYTPPAEAGAEWETVLVDDTLHATHNLDPVQWDASSEAEEILYLGREGGLLLSREGGGWSRRPLPGIRGGGEIRLGRHAGGEPFVVTIEPMHGSELVYYRFDLESGAPAGLKERVVLDDGLEGGHALATGDLLGDPGDEVVAGWRLPNRDGKVGLALYHRPGGSSAWESILVDDDGMATEDLRLGDLDGDGRLDIVAAGRATRNLKIYWNREPESAPRRGERRFGGREPRLDRTPPALF
jgi:hypothetical protein